jgi:hypothetical protein
MVRKISGSYKLGSMFSRTKFVLVFLLVCTENAAAQSVVEEKERAVIEVGAASVTPANRRHVHI